MALLIFRSKIDIQALLSAVMYLVANLTTVKTKIPTFTVFFFNFFYIIQRCFHTPNNKKLKLCHLMYENQLRVNNCLYVY